MCVCVCVCVCVCIITPQEFGVPLPESEATVVEKALSWDEIEYVSVPLCTLYYTSVLWTQCLGGGGYMSYEEEDTCTLYYTSVLWTQCLLLTTQV